MTSLDTNDVDVNDRSCPLASKAASCRGPAPIAGQQVTRGVYPTDAEALPGRPHSAQVCDLTRLHGPFADHAKADVIPPSDREARQLVSTSCLAL